MSIEQIQSTEQDYIAQLLDEHDAMDSANRAALAELISEMELSQAVMAGADRDIASAKALAAAISTRPNIKPATNTAELDFSRIGWINREGASKLDVITKGTPERPYLFGSIVDMSKSTREAFANLEKQHEAKHLMEQLQEHGIPKFLEDLHNGSHNLRPINTGNRNMSSIKKGRSVNTVYPTYKLDVLGTNNRAIVLVLPKAEETPVIVLAALFDHEGQDKVLKAISLKGH